MRLLVGIYRPDWDPTNNTIPMPTVVGAWDATIWEIVGDDEWDSMTKQAKQALDPVGGDWEWREVNVDIPGEAIKSLFATATVTGRVVPDE